MREKSYYAPYIDGLRAVAVLSVMAYHLNPGWLPGGFTGVDVFFVISGFVVSTSVHKLPPMRLGAFVTTFYARRVTRIVPALTVCLVATAIASALFIPNAYLSDTNQRTGVLAFFGLSNVLLAHRGRDYFSPHAEYNPFTHTWSLGVEEQFYLVFPLLFFAWILGRRRLSTGLFWGGLVASLLCAMWLAKVNQLSAFYLIWSRFWELAAGVLLFQWMAARGHSFDTDSPPSPAANRWAAVSLAVLLAGLWLANPAAAPMPAAILPVLGTLGLLGFVHGRHGGAAQRMLSLPALRFIGRISYSLYLWHWPVFVLARWTTGLEAHALQLSALVAAFALAILSYYWVELPTRRIGPRLARPVTIGAGLSLLATGLFASVLVNAAQPRLSLSTVARNSADWYVDWNDANRGATGCHVEISSTDFSGGQFTRATPSGCGGHAAAPAAATPQRTLYVAGDSHSGSYATMLGKFARATDTRIVHFTRGGCAFMSLGLEDERQADCARYNAEVIERILPQMRPGDVLFLPSLRLPRFTELAADAEKARLHDAVWNATATHERASAEHDASATLRRITDRGVQVVVEAPKPLYMSSPYRCSDWFNRDSPGCQRGESLPRDYLEDLRQPVMAALAHMHAANAAVVVWDPLPALCERDTCNAKVHGRPLFFDADHLSAYGNDVLLPYFIDFIGRLAPAPGHVAVVDTMQKAASK